MDAKMNKNLIVIGLFSALYGCGGSSGSPEEIVNTPASYSGDLSGSIIAGMASVGGTVTITDPDSGESMLSAQTEETNFGTFSIGADGAWSYTLDNNSADLIALGQDDEVNQSFTLTSSDGTTQSLNITVSGINDPAAFDTGGGADSATLTNNTASINGTLSVNDPDNGQSLIQEQTDALGMFGMFTISSAGAWVYTLDTNNASVMGLLDETDSVTEGINVASADGSSTTISINIVGVASAGGTGFTKGSIGNNDTVPDVNCTATVSSTGELEDVVSFDMTPGETLCLASGSYSGLDLTFGGTGTAEEPITIAAAVPGEVFIDGEVFVGMTGEYVVFQGFVFQDGAMDSSLMQTRANNNTACNNCRITENTFINMDEGLDDSTKWFQIYGSGNRFDHNWVSGKTTRGALFIVERGDAPGTEDRTQIDHNYFADRPPIGGVAYASNTDNEYEGIRIGTSDTHTSDSFAVIEHNYFERIDGEAEVISVKAGGVTVQHNTIRNSRGSIVNRHGEGSTIDNNFIIGDGNPFAGGIRIVDANHQVTNNYIEGARNSSSNFYGGILISAFGGSDASDYQEVENVLVANNTVVDSVNSVNFFAGREDNNPSTVYFVNNVVAKAIGPVLKNADELPTSSIYAGNYVFGQTFSDDDSVTSLAGFSFVDPLLSADISGLYRPTDSSADLSADSSADIGSYTLPTQDMDGQTRSTLTVSGSDEISTETLDAKDMRGLLTADLVGPLSYTPPSTKPHINKVDISNDDFDTQNLGGWINTDAEVTTDADEVFSRGSSVKLDSLSDSIMQTLMIEADTNYTLSAFIKGAGKLTATADGISYSTDSNSSSYHFTTVSFNSGTATSVDISVTMDDSVLGFVDIINSDFDNAQEDWVENDGTGIGQVQDSSNSASGDDGSIKFKYNDDDNGTPYDPYIAQTVTVLANTEYTLTIYNLLKDDAAGSSILFGAHSGEAIGGADFDSANVIASKNSVYGDLSEDDEADDSFRPDTLVFNSGENTSITIFAKYQSTTGDDIRVDDFSLSAFSAPGDDEDVFVDSFRLVSHASLDN